MVSGADGCWYWLIPNVVSSIVGAVGGGSGRLPSPKTVSGGV